MPHQFQCETDYCENQPTFEFRVFDTCGEFSHTVHLCHDCAEKAEEAGKDIRG